SSSSLPQTSPTLLKEPEVPVHTYTVYRKRSIRNNVQHSYSEHSIRTKSQSLPVTSLNLNTCLLPYLRQLQTIAPVLIPEVPLHGLPEVTSSQPKTREARRERMERFI